MNSFAVPNIKLFAKPFTAWHFTGRIWLWLATGLIAGCQGSTGSEPTATPLLTTSPIAIRELFNPAALPKTDSPQNIALKGTVGDRAPLLEAAVYELQDATGKIWVLTNGRSPEKGQEITIQGTVRYKSIPLNGKEQGSVYIEQK